MNVLTIDIGGTNIKILATGQKGPRKFPFGLTLSPQQCPCLYRGFRIRKTGDTKSAHGQPPSSRN
jgi:hypothetical protein